MKTKTKSVTEQELNKNEFFCLEKKIKKLN